MRQLAKRNDEDKEFEDELDYSTDVRASERFRKYKAIKNFRTTEWNIYVSKIYIFNFLKKKRMISQLNMKKFLFSMILINQRNQPLKKLKKKLLFTLDST